MRVLRWLVVVSVFGAVIACGSGTLPSAPEVDELAAFAEINQTSAKKHRPTVVELATWNVRTPAPRGMAQCTMVVKVASRVLKKDPKASILFKVEAFPNSGEAKVNLLESFGLSKEIRTNEKSTCNEFQDGPEILKFKRLKDFAKKGKTRVKQKFRVQLHAHKGGDCSAPGQAHGFFTVGVTAKGVEEDQGDLRVKRRGCK